MRPIFFFWFDENFSMRSGACDQDWGRRSTFLSELVFFSWSKIESLVVSNWFSCKNFRLSRTPLTHAKPRTIFREVKSFCKVITKILTPTAAHTNRRPRVFYYIRACKICRGPSIRCHYFLKVSGTKKTFSFFKEVFLRFSMGFQDFHAIK